jgi:glycosyltransferase involved in cell wall biosynthesis
VQGKILIDISRLLSRLAQNKLPTGVDRVCLAYVQHWGHRAQAVVQKGTWRRIFSHAVSQELFAILREPRPHFRRRANRAIAKGCMPPWPSQDAAGKMGFYLGHSGMEAPGFGQWIQTTRQNPVYFVHDLIPITHAEYCRPGEQLAHERRLKVMLHGHSGLICNSHNTLDLLASWARHHGLAVPPAVVAPLAPPSDLVLSPNATPPLPTPYFVVLGTIEPRKNHLLVLNVWRELVARLGAATPHLVVIGSRGWECENVVDMLERCDVLHPFVHEVPTCSDPDLARYLKHACALLFPSFAEGYGMPLVESLMLGTPVVASSLPVFREIAQDVPDYLSPIDGPGWLQAILDFVDVSHARRGSQLHRMRGFVLPTWDGHYAQVERLLEQLK